MRDTMARLWARLQLAGERRVADAVQAVWDVARAGTDMGQVGDTDLVAGAAPSRRPAASSSDALQGSRAALVLRDNVRFRRTIEGNYRLAIGLARREILIANAYFIPGVKLQRALLRAARRGVRITLLLQGRYEYFMAYHASRAVYGVLLQAGITIIEYEASFLHAKVAVMDAPGGSTATVGSSNLDPFSLLLAREANVFVRDETFAQTLRTHLVGAIAEGRRVAAITHTRRSLATRMLNWVAYALMRCALFITGNRY